MQIHTISTLKVYHTGENTQTLWKHNYQAHNSECNVVISCHELQMSDERNLVYRSHTVHDYTIFLLYISAGAEVKGRAGLPNDKNN